MTLEIGTNLGHYRILALLGRGGMADVYRAQDERLGREVALKALPPEFARDPERIERFEREVRAAAGLTHPNIVTVYEFGRGEGLHFYTMALMLGGDLKLRIRAHPGGIAPSEARAVAAAMARALDYAHQRGFVHRDVKPENILFGEDGTPQLTDFGIARAMASGTRMTATGMSIGSPPYMSPEHARSLRVDGRSDLYSLGVVLYEMLTGRVPFEGVDTLAVAYATSRSGTGASEGGGGLATGGGPAAGEVTEGSLRQRGRTGRGVGVQHFATAAGRAADAGEARSRSNDAGRGIRHAAGRASEAAPGHAGGAGGGCAGAGCGRDRLRGSAGQE